MGLITVLVFIGVFAPIALPLVAMQHPPIAPSRRWPRWTRRSKTRPARCSGSRSMNLRKDENAEQHSLAEQEAAEASSWRPICAEMLSQADLDWSPGRLLIMSVACFVIPVVCLLLTLKSDPWWRWGPAWCWAALPFACVMFKRRQAFRGI